MQPVAGFFEPRAIGFGAPAPGKSYPSIIVDGWYNIDTNMADARYGIWRSVDDVNHGVSGACSGGNTWQFLGDFPLGWMSPIHDLSGDMAVFGTVYGSFDGAGYFWGAFNFLLERDIDPASNDNTPLWLKKTR
jgi:hypothetical protein